MNKEDLTAGLKKLNPAFCGTILTYIKPEMFSRLEKGPETLNQALNETCGSAEIIFLEYCSSLSETEYAKLMQENTYILMLGTDYTDCPVMQYAKKLFGRTYSDEKSEQLDFHFIGTALENRFWGDEDAVRFVNIDGFQCRLVNYRLLVDYAADWMYKNRK